MRLDIVVSASASPAVWSILHLLVCSLSSGVLLLNLAVRRDEVERLGLRLQDSISVATEDNNNIEILETLVGLLEGDLGADDDALTAQNLGLSSGDGDVEGLGGCRQLSSQ